MKGYWVSVDYEWGDYVHGNTVTEAKKMFWSSWSMETDEWTRMRVKRVPFFDDKPLTSELIYEYLENLKPVGDLLDMDEALFPWHVSCTCEICKKSPPVV